MLPFLMPIVGMLAEKGLSLLSDTASSVTDKGVDKLKNFVKEKTGVNITDHKQVQNLTPEQIERLKRLELSEKKFFEEIKFKHYQADLQDRQDARDMQKEALKQSDKFSKRFVYIFALIWSLFVMVYLFGVTFTNIPQSNQRIVDTILGFSLGTIIATIIQFFYGSSHKNNDNFENKKNKEV